MRNITNFPFICHPHEIRHLFTQESVARSKCCWIRRDQTTEKKKNIGWGLVWMQINKSTGLVCRLDMTVLYAKSYGNSFPPTIPTFGVQVANTFKHEMTQGKLEWPHTTVATANSQTPPPHQLKPLPTPAPSPSPPLLPQRLYGDDYHNNNQLSPPLSLSSLLSLPLLPSSSLTPYMALKAHTSWRQLKATTMITVTTITKTAKKQQQQKQQQKQQKQATTTGIDSRIFYSNWGIMNNSKILKNNNNNNNNKNNNNNNHNNNKPVISREMQCWYVR